MKMQARIVLAVVFLLGLAQCCLAAQPSFLYGRYIVYTTGDPNVNEAARQGVEGRAGLILKELPTRAGLVVLIPDHARGPIVNIPGVVAVEPDVVLTAVKPPAGKPDKLDKPPKDEPPPEQPIQELPWGVDRIDADLVSVTGSGIGIAIIDTGIDNDHQDLMGNIAGGQNFVAMGKGPPWKRTVNPDAWDDDNGHGTHVAGITAAVDNEIGAIGVAPAAGLWAVKVLDKTGSGYLSDVIDGIYWAADNPDVDIINLSLGIDKETLDQYPNDKAALQGAVDYAYDSGVVVVAAAGNEGNSEGTGDNVIYPARFDSVIAVAATDGSDARADFSSTGPSVELAAPGVSIFSTWNDGLYETIQGTSMASPHVAGAAALVLASDILTDLNGDGFVDNIDARLQLQETADDLGEAGPDDLYGYGLVDAEEAATGETSP